MIEPFRSLCGLLATNRYTRHKETKMAEQKVNCGLDILKKFFPPKDIMKLSPKIGTFSIIFGNPKIA
jgi:hypothetical protein